MVVIYTVKISNLKMIKALFLLIVFLGYAFGQWGYFVTYSTKVQEFKKDLKMRGASPS
jgi:hypothetical protein